MNIPELVAHRGYTLHYPENTLIALESAVHAGARYIEVDVQLSADRVPVLFHDRTLERMCGVPGAVHERTWAELGMLHASEFGRFGYRFVRTPLARLADLSTLLARHPKVTAFVEIKRVAIENFGIETVLDVISPLLRPVGERCVLISFSPELLLAARQRMLRGDAAWGAVGAIPERWRDRKSGWFRELRPEFVFCDAEFLPRFGRLAIPGSKVAVYEVTDADLAIDLARRGVALIETFAIGELRDALRLAQPE